MDTDGPLKKFILYTVIALSTFALNAQVDFSANTNAGCGPLSVQFSDASSGAISWKWDLGNGNSSVLKDPSAIYTSPGDYDISLEIIDNSGNKLKKTVKAFIHVYIPPKSNFASSKRKLCPDDTLTFFNKTMPGDAAITGYYWDFGDGNSSTAANPVHKFTVPAFRNITLIATDLNGCFTVEKKSSYIEVWNPPTADFSLDSSLSCHVPTKVTFTSNVYPSTMPHTWDFGNGSTSTAFNTVNIYKTYGRFNVKLTVVDANGCRGSKTLNDAVVIDNLSPAFVMKSTIVCDTSTPAVFLNRSNVNTGYSAYWDFGDGKFSKDWLPQHKYAAFGMYTVSLKVIGPNCNATIKKNNIVRVEPKPRLKIRMNDTGACQIPFSMKLHSQSPASATVFWNYGDNTTGYGRSVQHTWDGADSFRVFADAVDVNSCASKDSIDVKVNYLLTKVKGQTSGCVPYDLDLKGSFFMGTNPISKEEWFINGVLTSSGPQLIHKFTDTGLYKVTYKATSSKGCIDTLHYISQVGMHTKPEFTADSSEICIHRNMTFTNKTDTGISPLKFYWVTTEGKIDSTFHFSTAFHKTQGKAKVTLVSVHRGCRDTIRHYDQVEVMTPRIDLETPMLDCILPDTLVFLNGATKHTRFTWSSDPAPIKKNHDSMWVLSSLKIFNVKMVAIDDSTGCADSGLVVVQLDSNQPEAKMTCTLLDTCLTARVRLADFGSKGQKLWWQIGDDTTKYFEDVISKNFNKYGEYTIRRIAVNRSPYQVCSDTMSVVLLLPEPDIRYSISAKTGCTPLTIDLRDSGWFPGKKAWWKIGDSILWSTGLHNAYTVKTPPANGKVPLFFTAYDSLGRCTENTATDTLTVTGPLADVQHSFHYTCSNTRIDLSFKKISTPNITAFAWTVDGVLQGTAATVSYLVSTMKTVQVRLQITDANGCIGEYNKTILARVFKPLIAIGSDVKGALCPPVTVQFYDSTYSFNNPVEYWTWDFGDGAGASIKNPVHTYASTGQYTVSLKVKNFIGCISTVSFPAFIDVKGPSGKIITGADSGCLPWQVPFRTTGTNLKDVAWDFGDGNNGSGIQTWHTYSSKGAYKATAIMEDSTGCKTATVDDTTMIGLLSATARIKQTSFCDNAWLDFQDQSDYAGQMPKNTWQFDQLLTNNSAVFGYMPVKSKLDTLHLTAYGPLGCNDTLHFIPRKSGFDFAVDTGKDTFCLGEPVTFKDLSLSDTTITAWAWNYGGQTAFINPTSFTAASRGFNNLTLHLKNALGCEDSITWKDITITGDTRPPINPRIIVSSVLPGNILTLKFEQNKAFDWSAYRIYDKGTTPPTLLKAVYTRGDTDQVLSSLDPLHNSYCLQVSSTNFCEVEAALLPIGAHCEVELRATSQTNRVQLNWNPYNGNLAAFQRIYRRELPSGTESLIKILPSRVGIWMDSTTKCKTEYSYRIETHFSNISERSSSDTSNALPIYLNNMKPPFISSASVYNNEWVLLSLDTGITPLYNTENFILERSHNGAAFQPWQVVNAHAPLDFMDQKANVNAHRNAYRVASTDACGGQSPWSPETGPMLLQAGSSGNGDIMLTWNPYAWWPGGVLNYEVEMQQPDGSYSALATTTDPYYLLPAAAKNCGEIKNYRVRAFSNTNPGFSDPMLVQNSISNNSSLAFPASVFIPNAFTPNGNNLNETFRPEVLWARDYTMFVYNRWGMKVAETHGCNSGWDGLIEGQLAPTGMYAYHVKLLSVNGLYINYKGTVLLMR